MSQSNQSDKKKSSVKYIIVSGEEEGQRIDNFLISRLKGVPKSHVYRIVRKGEVRVNKKRISPFYRLIAGDSVRLPPVFLAEKAKEAPPSQRTEDLLSGRILYEDDNLLIINKPSGMSVHAGSTVRVGVVEALRHMYPKLVNLELAHRLDSETSGCLILAKRKRILREVHALLREGQVTKLYWALTRGQWKKNELRVDLPLQKDYRDGGKHVVEVHHEGKSALTLFQPLQTFEDATLMEVKLFTGRTHQIRVHAAHQGHPIAGDDRYGEAEFNKLTRKRGLKRMFLHARSVDFILPSLKQRITVVAPLDPELEACIKAFETKR
ncbi:RluA family pseudouridine synthase [Aquicella lusitana]|uniref:Pseudouridine synthase n=1 Tax=Aquicella lusitana TaxID=254246 RepID=A0A370GYN1_9COXI|nr:RluA family pseudouridine synthase [Aquicella lusitana]RDI48768.1 ribosomal large subunit pseudouridine synthase C [Aquicella lusitana]VVC73196.1 Ribosomal large subunit pseudouridine synthase C [Aquicella lusitana]